MTHPLDITPDFLNAHAASLRALARSLLSDEGAAEDVLQDTWVTALQRPPGRRDRVSGWLRAVTRNAVVDHLRARKRQQGREESLPEQEPAAPLEELPFLRDSLSPHLSQALSALPAAQRQAVELLQVQGLSVVEAAARAGVSPGALKVRAHRGYRAMRSRLREHET